MYGFISAHVCFYSYAETVYKTAAGLTANKCYQLGLPLSGLARTSLNLEPGKITLPACYLCLLFIFSLRRSAYPSVLCHRELLLERFGCSWSFGCSKLAFKKSVLSCMCLL